MREQVSVPNEARTEAALEKQSADVRAKANRANGIRVAGASVAFIVAIVVVNVVTHGNFLTRGNLTNVLRQIAQNAIDAVGQTFVIITAGIDLSIGSLLALCGVVMAQVVNATGLTGIAAVLVALVVGLAVGGGAGAINAIPVVRLNLPPFITTLAMMLVARGLAFTLSGGQPVPLHTTAFDAIGTGYLFGVAPYAVVIMLVVVIVFGIVLAKTRFGRYVYALGGNEEAARLAGIRVQRTKLLVYVISGACAGLAGFLEMSRFGTGSPQTGTGYELQAIAAVVVGGTSLAGGRGSITGTFLGALFIGVLNNVMNLANVQSYTQQIVLGVVILLAVVLDELRKRYLART
jgi:ribose/xylose/arabinose/galactoside ABC-type transport system permease subunit